jgi:branched-chain amino acid transport system substrate-binding protein
MMLMRTRVAVALAGTLCLVLAACGSRLDHDTIVRAAPAAGAGTGVGADGQGGVASGDGLRGGVDGSGPGADGPGKASGPGAGTAAGSSGRAGGAGGSNGGPGGGRSGGPPLVIGTIGSFSGGTADLLGPGARAVKAWAADINSKGGVGGRQVKVIARDDGGEPGRAKAAMRQLVEEDKVVAVVGAMAITETITSWRGYVEDKGVPVIGGFCGIEGWEGPVMFRHCPAQPTVVFGTAKLGAAYARSKALGGLFCSEVDACTTVEKQLFNEGYAKRAGLDPRYQAKISLFQTDFTAECIQARDRGVGLLWVAGDAGTISRVAASCNRQNYRPQFISPAGAMSADTVTKPGLGDIVVGAPVFPFAGVSTPAASEFAAVWKRYGGGSAPNAAAADGWVAAQLFEKAVRSAGGDISRASLIKATRGLRNERLGGLTVPLNFGPRGTTDVKCIYFMRGSGGKWAAPKGDKPTCW